MNISVDRITITMTPDEARAIYCYIRGGIGNSIQTYWKHDPTAYVEGERMSLNMMEQIGRFTDQDFPTDSSNLSVLLACEVEKLKTKP